MFEASFPHIARTLAMCDIFYGWKQQDKETIHAIIDAWTLELVKTYPRGMSHADIQEFAGMLKKPKNDESWTPDKSIRLAKYIRDKAWPDIEVLDEDDFTEQGILKRDFLILKREFAEKKAENAFLEARCKQNKAQLKELQKKTLKMRLEEKLEERLKK